MAPGLFVCGTDRLLVTLSQWLKQHRGPPTPRPLLNNCTRKAGADFLLRTFPWKTESGGVLPPSHAGHPGFSAAPSKPCSCACLTCSSGVFRMNGAVDKDWGCFSNCFLNNQTARQHFQRIYANPRLKLFCDPRRRARLFLIKCLSSLSCAFVFTEVRSGLRVFRPGPWLSAPFPPPWGWPVCLPPAL